MSVCVRVCACGLVCVGLSVCVCVSLSLCMCMCVSGPSQALSIQSLLFLFAAQIESHPAYQDGIVYVSAEESITVYALNATTGMLRASKKLLCAFTLCLTSSFALHANDPMPIFFCAERALTRRFCAVDVREQHPGV